MKRWKVNKNNIILNILYLQKYLLKIFFLRLFLRQNIRIQILEELS